MNVERLMKVRDFIVANPNKLNMAFYIDTGDKRDADPTFGQHLEPHNCGTVLCIAGLTIAMFRPDCAIQNDGSPGLQAQRLLDLDFDQGIELFAPKNFVRAGYTADDAVKAIDSLIETGTPSWPTKERR